MVSKEDLAAIDALVKQDDVQCALNKLGMAAREGYDGLNGLQKFGLQANLAMAESAGFDNAQKMIANGDWQIPSGAKEMSQEVLAEYNALAPETRTKLAELQQRLAAVGQGAFEDGLPSFSNAKDRAAMLDVAEQLSPALEPGIDAAMKGVMKQESPACKAR